MRRVLAFLRSGRGLSPFATAVLAWMILVILWGAVVRATGSGAGCGDHWPLCNGDFFPRHPRLATVIEFAHRSMSGICTALVASLLIWTFLAHSKGARVRKAAAWSAILLVTEALLGAVLVLGGFVERNTSNMRVFVQGVHLTNTLLLLGALTLAWWWQQPRADAPVTPPSTRALAAAAVLCTLATGATGSVAALADTLFPSANLRSALLADLSNSSPLLVRMRFLHPTVSLAAMVFIAWLGWRFAGARARWLFSFIALQIVLGVADVLWLAPVTLQVLHLFGADLLWIALVVVASEAWLPSRERRFAPHRASAAASFAAGPV